MFSLCPFTVSPCAPLEQIDAAAAAGFDAIGLRLVPTIPSDVDVMADRGVQAAILERLAATGIKVLDIEVIRLTPETDVKALVPMLEYAGKVGAQFVTVTGVNRDGPCDRNRAVEEELIVPKLVEICQATAQFGIKPAIEFQAYRTIPSLEAALRLRELAQGQDPVTDATICFDALHFQRSGGSVADLTESAVRTFSSFQLCDAPLQAPEDLAYEARYGRVFPGDGELPLVEVMAALPKDLAVSVEVPSAALSNVPVLERAQWAARVGREIMAAGGRG